MDLLCIILHELAMDLYTLSRVQELRPRQNHLQAEWCMASIRALSTSLEIQSFELSTNARNIGIYGYRDVSQYNH